MSGLGQTSASGPGHPCRARKRPRHRPVRAPGRRRLHTRLHSPDDAAPRYRAV